MKYSRGGKKLTHEPLYLEPDLIFYTEFNTKLQIRFQVEKWGKIHHFNKKMRVK